MGIRKSRKLTTGRFDTRQELIDYVHCRYWEARNVKTSTIARNVGLSEVTVSKIIENEKPSYDYKADAMALQNKGEWW